MGNGRIASCILDHGTERRWSA